MKPRLPRSLPGARRLADVVDRLSPHRRPLLAAIHLGLISAAYLLAFQLRFEFPLARGYWDLFLRTLPLLLVARGISFAWYRLHQGLWKYVSMQDVVAIFKAVSLGSLVFVGEVTVLFGRGFPRSIYVLEWLLCLTFVGGIRLATRVVRESAARPKARASSRALIVGAGDAGEMLARAIGRNGNFDYEVVGFVDDDRRKRGARIHGVEVLGGIDDLPRLCRTREVDEVLVAIPSASAGEQRRLLERCRETGLVCKTVPPLEELLQGRASIGQLQEVRPEDLLGRPPVRLDRDQISRQLEGRRVLVTGAAGSIGSELCRQIAGFGPEALLLFDRAESGLYFLDLELKLGARGAAAIPIIGDILDRGRVEEVVRQYRPDFIYHAAAYKHVPLMEEHPLEAIANNVFGTEAVALAARHGGVEKFVLVSTDKAVRPVGTMGMTKRLAECLIRATNESRAAFVAVRFGNVLGSDGSVLPLFQWQIARGAPITVTDPQATRYFMLVSEAAQLVLQAGAMGKGGEVFFLDMGESVKIMDLAQNVVRLAGLKPGRDIQIQVTGLRPGERLNELLVTDGQEFFPTDHEKVLAVHEPPFDAQEFRDDLGRLRALVAARDARAAAGQLRAMADRY